MSDWPSNPSPSNFFKNSILCRRPMSHYRGTIPTLHNVGIGGRLVSPFSSFSHRFSTTMTFARLHAYIYALQSCKHLFALFFSLFLLFWIFRSTRYYSKFVVRLYCPSNYYLKILTFLFKSMIIFSICHFSNSRWSFYKSLKSTFSNSCWRIKNIFI